MAIKSLREMKREKHVSKAIDIIDSTKADTYKNALMLLITACEFEVRYRQKKIPVVVEAIKKIKTEMGIT